MEEDALEEACYSFHGHVVYSAGKPRATALQGLTRIGLQNYRLLSLEDFMNLVKLLGMKRIHTQSPLIGWIARLRRHERVAKILWRKNGMSIGCTTQASARRGGRPKATTSWLDCIRGRDSALPPLISLAGQHNMSKSCHAVFRPCAILMGLVHERGRMNNKRGSVQRSQGRNEAL